MTAQVKYCSAEANNALVIPSGALGEARGVPARCLVRVVDANGRAEPRSVKCRNQHRVMAQILTGLTAGERVIVSDSAARERRSHD